MSKKWNEICADDFGKTEADVACHQLGFVNALNNGTGARSIYYKVLCLYQ